MLILKKSAVQSPPQSRRPSIADTVTPKLTLNQPSEDEEYVEEDRVPEITTKAAMMPVGPKMTRAESRNESESSFESNVDPTEYRRKILAKVERSKRKLSTRLSIPQRHSRANSSDSAIEEGETSPTVSSP